MTTEVRETRGKQHPDDFRRDQIMYAVERHHAQQYADWAGEIAERGIMRHILGEVYDEHRHEGSRSYQSPIIELGPRVDPDGLQPQFGRVSVHFYLPHRPLRRVIADTLRLTKDDRQEHVTSVGVNFYADGDGKRYLHDTKWNGSSHGTVDEAKLVLGLMQAIQAGLEDSQAD